MSAGTLDPVEWAVSLSHELTRGRALDVACGEGRFLLHGMVGLDLDPDRLALARAASTSLVVGDARRLPFADGTFDTAFAHRMLNDTGQVDTALREMARVLRPAGRLLVFTRARPGEGDRLDRSNGERRLRDHFATVEVRLHPTDERAAFFVAGR